MRPRTGFTLLELAIALSLTAIAASVAAGALWSARRTSEAQVRFGAYEGAEMRWRALLTDMLRHAPAAERVDEPLLALRETAHGPVLRFLSQGVQEPFGTGIIWVVVVREDSAGVLLEAQPLRSPAASLPDLAPQPVLLSRLPAAEALRIEVLESGGGDASGPTADRRSDQADQRWRPDWSLAQMRPSAVTIRWRDRRTDHTASPFTLRLTAFSDELAAAHGASSESADAGIAVSTDAKAGSRRDPWRVFPSAPGGG